MTVNIIQDRDGNLWFGSRAGLTRFDGQTFTRVTTRDGLAADGVNAIFQDQNKLLWFATEKGVSRYDGKQFITFTEDDGLPGENVVSIAEEDDGHLFFATKEGFIARYDGQDFATFAIGDHRDDFSPRTSAMVVDRQGHLWFGTNSGVVRYDGREWRSSPADSADVPFVNFTVEDGLAGNEIKAILEDREGHLWFGTLSGGISRYDGAQFTHFTTQDGLPSFYIFDVVQDRQGDLWFGTSDGAVRYDGQNFTTFTTEDGLGANRVWDVFADSRGNLWFGWYGSEDSGVSRYDGREFKTFTRADGLGESSEDPIYEDRAGNMWFGLADGGVSRYDGRTSKIFTRADGLAGNSVWTIYQDRAGNMWFGTEGGGAVRYDGSEFKTFTQDDGLFGNWVEAIYQDRAGNMWFVGIGGLSRHDGERFTSFSADDGLPPGGVVFSIFADRRDHLWLSVFGVGAVRYDGRVFQTLSRRDGLTDDGVHAIVQDRDGAMWIATDGGITRYLASETPPSIFLKEVVADRTYGAVEALELPSTQAFVRFAFQGQSFSTRPEQMVYVFRLQGYDEDWRQTRQNQVEYRDLPAGDYVFEVKAVDRDLNYSPDPATVHLRVHPPYLQLALIGSLGLALVGLAIASGYGIKRRRERDRLQRDRDQAREQLVRERRQRVEVQPHDIEQWTLDDFVEESSGMRLLFDEIGRRQAESDSRVLIAGEAGTGKELMARAIHAGSNRSSGNFVAVRCALLPTDMTQMEQRTQALSQLFGYLEEAFGKGNRAQDGYVQQAAGGTLFFDEISLVPLPLQTHLLRVLTQGEVRRLGTEQAERIDLRVLAATSMDVAAQVASGAFHAEWYEYLAAHRLAVPPLRERPKDIARLAQYFAQAEVPLDAAVVEQLQSYDYPGNVRELKTIIERALIESGGRSIGIEHLHLPS